MSRRKFWCWLLLACIVFVLSTQLDFLEIDSAQYAQISLEMMQQNNWLQVHCLGADYLDKPPLLFWLNASSMKLLGPGNLSGRLPSLLFALLGLYSLYGFVRLHYKEEIAQWAALMLAASPAMFFMTFDVRTDTLLMGSVMFSIWQWSLFFKKGETHSLLLGTVGVGLGLLAKGPVAVIAVGTSLLPHLLLTYEWRKIFDWRMILVPLLLAIMLLPMCVGLYQQFGVHGLRFYFWEQSFGRITGENKWNNHPDTFFLLHSAAWLLLPWTVFFVVGWWQNLRSLFRRNPQPEWISLSGFTLMLLFLSLSKYQLPHYVFVTLPLALVPAARVASQATSKKWWGIQLVIAVVSLLLVAGLLLAFAPTYWLGWMVMGMLVVFAALLLFRKQLLEFSLSVAMGCSLLLATAVYPALMRYQPNCDFGRYVKAQADNHYVTYCTSAQFSTVFYAQQMPALTTWDFDELKKSLTERKELLIITTPASVKQLRQAGCLVEVIEQRKNFRVSILNWQFINPRSRDAACEELCLIKLR